MRTLSERLRWIAKQRKVDQRTFGLQAGLSHAFLSAYLQRAREDPEASIAADAAAKLADMWKVDLRWLITGEGQPEPDVELVVEHPARYPNLSRAMEMARWAMRETLEVVQRQHWEMDNDQPVDWWLMRGRLFWTADSPGG